MTAPHPRPRSPFAVLLSLAASCSGTPAPAVHEHTITTCVTVTDDALLPAPAVTIPAMSTVVWRNRSANELSIELDSASCPNCDTVFGFVPGEGGARSAKLAPGAVATLCFHALGTFPFVARTGGKEHRGSIEVGSPR